MKPAFPFRGVYLQRGLTRLGGGFLLKRAWLMSYLELYSGTVGEYAVVYTDASVGTYVQTRDKRHSPVIWETVTRDVSTQARLSVAVCYSIQ